LLIVTAGRLAIGIEEVHPEENPILNFAKKKFSKPVISSPSMM
jgi:hypothetical protein